MEIKSNEFEIIGKWIFLDNKIVEDKSLIRINFLKENCLEKISVSSSGWEILYKDPNDGRFWELIYLESENHGGGAPTLVNITKEAAIEKYNFSPAGPSSNNYKG